MERRAVHRVLGTQGKIWNWGPPPFQKYYMEMKEFKMNTNWGHKNTEWRPRGVRGLGSKPTLHSLCSSASCPTGLSPAPTPGIVTWHAGRQCHSWLAWLPLSHDEGRPGQIWVHGTAAWHMGFTIAQCPQQPGQTWVVLRLCVPSHNTIHSIPGAQGTFQMGAGCPFPPPPGSADGE